MVAEGVGFEPTLRFPVNTLSKRAPSATRPPLQLPAERYVMQARTVFFKSNGQFFNHRKTMKPARYMSALICLHF